ncbi:MAG: hypothetical protein ED556_05050 [Winogradskyella sp.]|uniref:hypothetical protein n=1 Tax=Winogradskyella sp. TaxID=1883156 RepID=UPI000F3F2FBA|nr:hypothetical protein [Winogradskyella sp.]RNC86792.1 MAG: hypothetical protein ED556_05050 [Winogradskyella sp.]
MISNTFKWILKLAFNAILVVSLPTFLIYLIGYSTDAKRETIAMELAIGFVLVILTAFFNLFFIVPTIFVEEKWAKILFTFLPVFIALLITLLFNVAWTFLALFLALIIANTIWFYRLHRKSN